MLNKKKKQLNVVSQIRVGTSRATILRQRSLRSGAFSSPQSRPFSVKLYVAETDEIYTVYDCYRELTMRNLKSRLELLVGIPVNFQRLQYLDEVDLTDCSTFKNNDIIPGGTLTMRIWSQDAWGRLVATAAKGNNKKMHVVGATKTSMFSTAHSELLGPAEKSDWLAHRTFVALFVTVRRGHVETVEFLLQNGADLTRKTPLGRTALHVAVTSGQGDCIDVLLNYGARINDEDNDGCNAIHLARQWGQKESERRLFRHQWKMRTGRHAQLSTKPKLDEKVET
ncbi:ankyrin repeat domain-containing protein 60 [Rhineura floridana]|uniref:ankyrin repeat domain-containing protein 60 n=1 Tax=Rhineura floridana TaxID=261503 RepID=UPI002AC8693F|nr:ankyrin repeat domain-containing protein 60 [Rhineura floridana]